MDEKKALAIEASLEGTSAMLREAGQKRTVSTIELFVLCNMAEIGICSLLMQSDDSEVAQGAKEMREQTIRVLDECIGKPDWPGVEQIKHGAIALLHAGRFDEFVCR